MAKIADVLSVVEEMPELAGFDETEQGEVSDVPMPLVIRSNSIHDPMLQNDEITEGHAFTTA